MSLQARLIIIFLSISLLFFVLNLIRKRKMKIEYSILWIIVVFIIFIMSIWQPIADQLAFLLGISYPPGLFFSIAIFFLFVILLHFSVEVSKLKEQNQTLTQELAILKYLQGESDSAKLTQNDDENYHH